MLKNASAPTASVVCASTRPVIVVDAPIAAVVPANIVPAKADIAPMSTVVPIDQKTFEASGALLPEASNMTIDEGPMANVVVVAMFHTLEASPSSTSTPKSVIVDAGEQ
jgi:hypothetical protein